MPHKQKALMSSFIFKTENTQLRKQLIHAEYIKIHLSMAQNIIFDSKMQSRTKTAIKLLVCYLALAQAQSEPTETCPGDPFELPDRCGNKCELTCDNMGEKIVPFTPGDYEGCENRCICKNGYIRDEDGDCVRQTRRSCGEYNFSDVNLEFFTQTYTLLQTSILAPTLNTLSSNAVLCIWEPLASSRIVGLPNLDNTTKASAFANRAMRWT
jgi:Trypsin Inhibitor like cysteine rich domain